MPNNPIKWENFPQISLAKLHFFKIIQIYANFFSLLNRKKLADYFNMTLDLHARHPQGVSHV